jgi:type II secretory pathway predicted ATPase ExeA
MYSGFYGFTKEPFQTTPDAAFLFLTASHREALASIVYAIQQRKGFVAITGEVGVGKTTILRSYLESIDKKTQRAIYIFNPRVTFESLLATILRELDVAPLSTTAADMVTQLHEVLLTEYRAGSTVVLVIDEAHNIPAETLEGIRMLSNLETSAEKLIQMVLVGQPELQTLLDRRELRQVRDRIAVRARIYPLTREESVAYIEHRLAHAGANKPGVFSAGALRLIAKTAKGIPRRLNILCDNALVTGFGYKERVISRKIAKEVIRDFNEGSPMSSWTAWRRPAAYAGLAVLAVALPSFLYLVLGLNVHGGNLSIASPEVPTQVVSKPKPEPPAPSATMASHSAGPVASVASNGTLQSETSSAAKSLPPTAEGSVMLAANSALLTENQAELHETARLLAVLLDSGRVVVGRAQPAINNPRLEDKGFSSAVFESQLRQEFLTRTGHDLRNLAAAPMPEHAKPMLVRLAYFMQKAVQEVQSDINKKGIGFKGFIPATFGTKVAERFSKDTGLKVRQIGPPGMDPRNPNNKPDDVEEHALVLIQKSHPRVGDHVIEQQLADSSVRVLLPLFYKKQCLACHGKPKGEVDISGYEKEGFKEGDLGGAISVALPGHPRVSRDDTHE